MPGCDPESDAGLDTEIVDGEVTTTDPAVVAVAAVHTCQDATDVYCSGTLIAPRVVLTAAHCVNQPVDLVQVFFGDDSAGSGQWRRAAALRSHADFDGQTYANDIGAIILGEDAPVAPMVLNDAPLSAATLGVDARIVGFGVPGPGGGALGLKRSGQTLVSVVEAETFEIVPNPAMSCQIDSGGPVLLRDDQDVEVVAGVTSNGDPFCEEFAVNTRVDSYLADFLVPVLDEAASGELTPPPAPDPEDCPGCSVLGCSDGEVCEAQSDTCVPDPDEGPEAAGGGCIYVSSDHGPREAILLLLLVVFVRRRRTRASEADSP